MSRGRIANFTRRPDAEVARLVRLAYHGPRSIEVHEYRTLAGGKTFTPRDAGKPILLAIGSDRMYPQLDNPRKAAVSGPRARQGPIVLADWREELVLKAAHEAHHARTPGRASSDDDETQAEAHARAVLRRYRSR